MVGYTPLPRHQTLGPPPTPTTEIWWWPLETCSNLFTWGHPLLVLWSSGGHQNTYHWQANGMYSTGMLPSYTCNAKHIFIFRYNFPRLSGKILKFPQWKKLFSHFSLLFSGNPVVSCVFDLFTYLLFFMTVPWIRMFFKNTCLSLWLHFSNSRNMIQKCIPFALVQLEKITAKEHHRPLQYTQAGPKQTGNRRTFQTCEDSGNQVQD